MLNILTWYPSRTFQGGFGDNAKGTRVIHGVTNYCNPKYNAQFSDGPLAFKPSQPSHPSSVIDELAVLLTAGRLSSNTRAVLIAAYRSFIAEVDFDLSGKIKRVEWQVIAGTKACEKNLEGIVRTYVKHNVA